MTRARALLTFYSAEMSESRCEIEMHNEWAVKRELVQTSLDYPALNHRSTLIIASFSHVHYVGSLLSPRSTRGKTTEISGPVHERTLLLASLRDRV